MKRVPCNTPTVLAYPEDTTGYDYEDIYMFGDDILYHPYMSLCYRKVVYLPKGEHWREVATGKVYEGGQCVTAVAPIDTIPLFIRQGSDVSCNPTLIWSYLLLFMEIWDRLVTKTPC